MSSTQTVGRRRPSAVRTPGTHQSTSKSVSYVLGNSFDRRLAAIRIYTGLRRATFFSGAISTRRAEQMNEKTRRRKERVARARMKETQKYNLVSKGPANKSNCSAR